MHTHTRIHTHAHPHPMPGTVRLFRLGTEGLEYVRCLGPVGARCVCVCVIVHACACKCARTCIHTCACTANAPHAFSSHPDPGPCPKLTHISPAPGVIYAHVRVTAVVWGKGRGQTDTLFAATADATIHRFEVLHIFIYTFLKCVSVCALLFWVCVRVCV